MNKLRIRLIFRVFWFCKFMSDVGVEEGLELSAMEVAVIEQICSQCGKSQQVLYFIRMLSSIANRAFTR